jgi:hypothetical protein
VQGVVEAPLASLGYAVHDPAASGPFDRGGAVVGRAAGDTGDAGRLAIRAMSPVNPMG